MLQVEWRFIHKALWRRDPPARRQKSSVPCCFVHCACRQPQRQFLPFCLLCQRAGWRRKLHHSYKRSLWFAIVTMLFTAEYSR